MRYWPLAALAACFLCVGCVKEERTTCPCYLTLYFDGVIASESYREAVTTLGPTPERSNDQEKIALWQYEGCGYEVKVLKDLVRVSVVCGFKNGSFRSDSYVVPYSLQSDPIMAFAMSKRCEAERESADVVLHKQYCRINFRFEGLDNRSDYPYELRVNADCNAIGLYDLRPEEGPFSALAVESASGTLYVLLPRQKSNSLSLDLLDKASEVVYRLDLGAQMERRGYDWTKADLDDVDVVINYTMASVNIEIKAWDQIYETVVI